MEIRCKYQYLQNCTEIFYTSSFQYLWSHALGQILLGACGKRCGIVLEWNFRNTHNSKGKLLKRLLKSQAKINCYNRTWDASKSLKYYLLSTCLYFYETSKNLNWYPPVHLFQGVPVGARLKSTADLLALRPLQLHLRLRPIRMPRSDTLQQRIHQHHVQDGRGLLDTSHNTLRLAV